MGLFWPIDFFDEIIFALFVCINSKVPILFIHGEKDYFIPSYNSQYMYNNYKKDKDILIVKNAGHCESYLRDKKNYYNKIKEFCDKYL